MKSDTLKVEFSWFLAVKCEKKDYVTYYYLYLLATRNLRHILANLIQTLKIRQFNRFRKYEKTLSYNNNKKCFFNAFLNGFSFISFPLVGLFIGETAAVKTFNASFRL